MMTQQLVEHPLEQNPMIDCCTQQIVPRGPLSPCADSAHRVPLREEGHTARAPHGFCFPALRLAAPRATRKLSR